MCTTTPATTEERRMRLNEKKSDGKVFKFTADTIIRRMS
jgi:hypothetical protein